LEEFVGHSAKRVARAVVGDVYGGEVFQRTGLWFPDFGVAEKAGDEDEGWRTRHVWVKSSHKSNKKI
jgi:hypothetical protein